MTKLYSKNLFNWLITLKSMSLVRSFLFKNFNQVTGRLVEIESNPCIICD